MDFKEQFDNQVAKNHGVRKATASDMRDAELFGQIAELCRQVSVKNRKNMNDLISTYNFPHSYQDRIIQIFEEAKEKAENGEKVWF